MVTRSGAGGSMPPAVGVITDRVIAKRPDLEGMLGFTVRAPPKLDIASAEGSIRVWVDPKGMGVEEGETSFPTVVLSAEELRTACQVHGGDGSGPAGELDDPEIPESLDTMGFSRRASEVSFVEESEDSLSPAERDGSEMLSNAVAEGTEEGGTSSAARRCLLRL